MKKQKGTIIDEKTLSNKEKEDVYYHVKITKYKDLTSKDLIYVKVMN